MTMKCYCSQWLSCVRGLWYDAARQRYGSLRLTGRHFTLSTSWRTKSS